MEQGDDKCRPCQFWQLIRCLSGVTRIVIVFLIVALVFLPLLWYCWGKDSNWGFLINLAFMLVGFAIAFAAQLIVRDLERCQLKTDVAVALHAEISDRLARSVCDYNDPWHSKYRNEGEINEKNLNEMTSLKLSKFEPLTPIIYPALAERISALNNEDVRLVLRFYFRLERLRVDVQNCAKTIAKNGMTDNEKQEWLALLCKRFHQTLAPGLEAITELGRFVPNAKAIEDETFKAVKATSSSWNSVEKSLRAFIEQFCNDNPKTANEADSNATPVTRESGPSDA